MRQKLSLLLCLSLGLACLSAYGQKDSDQPVVIGYTLQDLQNPYFQALANGCRDRARELGIQIIIKDGASSTKTQIDQIREFIEMGVDAVICSPVESSSMEALVEECHKRDILFINPNQEIKGADAHIALDEYDFGMAGGIIAGHFIRDVLQEQAHVLILNYTPDKNLLLQRETGLIDGIHKFAPEAVIVARIPAHTPEMGMIRTKEALQLYPEIRVIAAINDSGAIGAYKAVKTLGLDTAEFCIVGLDATDQAISKMKHPDSIFRGTIDINPYGSGKVIIDVTQKVLKNGPLMEVVPFPMKPVTRDNLHLY